MQSLCLSIPAAPKKDESKQVHNGNGRRDVSKGGCIEYLFRLGHFIPVEISTALKHSDRTPTRVKFNGQRDELEHDRGGKQIDADRHKKFSARAKEQSDEKDGKSKHRTKLSYGENTAPYGRRDVRVLIR